MEKIDQRLLQLAARRMGDDLVVCATSNCPYFEWREPKKECNLELLNSWSQRLRTWRGKLKNPTCTVDCPLCKALTCTDCKQLWLNRTTKISHQGKTCVEFQRSSNPLYEKERNALTRNRNCPHCNAFVERIAGCAHMACTCGGLFCFICGKDFSPSMQHLHNET